MKQVQIAIARKATSKGTNWDDSVITAVGMQRNGRSACPKSAVAKDLPEPWLPVWHAIIQELSKLDPNGWAATFIMGEKLQEMVQPEPAGETQDPEPVVREYINLTIHRMWDDNTTAEPIILPIEQPEAVAFFDWLTRDEQPASQNV